MGCKTAWDKIVEFLSERTGFNFFSVRTELSVAPTAQSILAETPQAVFDSSPDLLALTQMAEREPLFPAYPPEDAALTDEQEAKGSLGGFHPKFRYQDKQQITWMYKIEDPNRSAMRSYAEATAGQVARSIHLRAAPVYLRSYNGKFGTLQPLAKIRGALPEDPRDWTKQQIADLIRYHPLTYLLSDADRQSDNYVVLRDGHAMIIDIAQAYRFFPSEGLTLKGLNPQLHRSANYFWVLFQRSGVKLSRQEAWEILEPVLVSIEKLPDQDFIKYLEPLVEANLKYKKAQWYSVFEVELGKEIPNFASLSAEDRQTHIRSRFYERVLERKHTIRENFLSFLDEVYQGESQEVAV